MSSLTAPPAVAGPIPHLPELLSRQVGAVLAGLTEGEAAPLVLYGLGRHTDWLVRAVPEFWSVPWSAVLDDDAGVDRTLDGVPVLTPEAAAVAVGAPGCVVLSTDCWQAAMTERVRTVFGSAPRVVDLYEGWPAGPYDRSVEVRPVIDAGGGSPSPMAVRRAVRALGPHLHREGLGRVAAEGPHRLTREVAETLDAMDGCTPVHDVDRADAIVVIDGDLERRGAPSGAPAPGPVRLPLFDGERPWVDRTAGGAAARADLDPTPVRIALRHDNQLGDVILSSGVLPERIKTELYPRAHLTFVTTGVCSERPGSASSGWCADILRHHPWIDRVVTLHGPRDGWPARWDEIRADTDLDFEIRHGWLYHDIFDVHALQVELPPGRTDARLYLDDADRAVAAAALEGRPGPRIAVNMSLADDRLRGWGAARTEALCAGVERLGGVVVWIGWSPFGGHPRLAVDGRPLTVREQAAVLEQCDVHVTAQGAGANLSAAVGTQTLALSGCHPACREGVAWFGNRYIDDPSRHHVEIYRYRGERRVLRYADGRAPEWSLRPGEAASDVQEYIDHLWFNETPFERLGSLGSNEWFGRVRRLTVEDVLEVLAAMLEARRSGRPAPGV